MEFTTKDLELYLCFKDIPGFNSVKAAMVFLTGKLGRCPRSEEFNLFMRYIEENAPKDTGAEGDEELWKQ